MAQIAEVSCHLQYSFISLPQAECLQPLWALCALGTSSYSSAWGASRPSLLLSLDLGALWEGFALRLCCLRHRSCV